MGLKEALIEKHLEAMQWEYEEEVKEKHEKLNKWGIRRCKELGLIYALTVESSGSGLSGRVLYDLSSPTDNALKVGDVLQIHNTQQLTKNDGGSVGGIVTRVGMRGRAVTLACKECLPVGVNDCILFAKVANDVTFERMRKALRKLEKMENAVSQACFSSDAINLNHTASVTFYDKGLNESQQAAVKAALADNNPLVLIHGPPGTGKTQTLLEIIRQLEKQNKKLLVCGPSNLSVDNIVERASSEVKKLVRLGHPARITEKAQARSYEHLLAQRNDYEVVRDIKSQLDVLVRGISTRKATREEYVQMREMRKDLRTREMRVAEEFLRSMSVVCCTLTGADDRIIREVQFDVVIIDEASQALEGESWIALLKGKRVILAGDHQQLPPTVMNEKAERVLKLSLFERLVKLHPECSLLLNVQYRMHEDIMRWSNEQFYHGKLVAHASVGKRQFEELLPCMLIDTAGFDMREDAVEEEESKSNRHELDLAISHVKKLLHVDVRDIAIIAPYSAQVLLLWDRIMQEQQLDGAVVEIGTVDSFQGREKDAIIYTFVRSNDEQEIGFLRELRRSNVAITRARKHVCLIMDSDTICRHEQAYKKLHQLVDSWNGIEYPEVE